MKKYFIVAKYQSKYGLILYACSGDSNPDLNNVYLSTLYFKGSKDIVVGQTYEFNVIKGENGLNYCFFS